MLFNSYTFCLLFLPLVLAGWWILPRSPVRLGFVTLASYFFYGWWDYRFVPLMIVSTSADYLAGLAIAGTEDERKRRTWLVLLLILNLGILGFFKYADFFLGTLNGIGRVFGVDPDLPLLRVVLPIGISFYTFNSISYTIDIYRRRLAPARNVLEFSAFVALFPHLVAGPIVRYADMAPQFDALPRRPDPAQWVTGLWLLGLGLAKKVLIADPIAHGIVNPLWEHAGALDAAEAWLATAGYTLQIYFDFSGYSDMAVGLAFLLGFRFPQNFNSPYRASSIPEFWRRWHMSLSFWLRDYLFIPLGGSRGTLARTARNLFITMFLGGLWHGAAWTFVAWGLYHGALLAAHARLRSRGWTVRSRTLAVAATLLAVMVGWVLFRSASFGEARAMLTAMTGLGHGAGDFGYLLEPGALLIGAAGAGIALFAPNTWEIGFPRSRLAALGLAALFLFCILKFAEPSPFLYFQF